MKPDVVYACPSCPAHVQVPKPVEWAGHWCRETGKWTDFTLTADLDAIGR